MAVQTTTIKVVADTSQAERALGNLNNALSGLITAASAVALAKFADEVTNVRNKLALVTQAGQSANEVFRVIGKTAVNLGAPLKDVGDLFFRVANNTKDLGLAQTEQLAITQNLIKGFQLTGATMGEVSGGVVQLGQAFAQGVLRGDELNSVMEQLPMVADALAKKFDVQRGALKFLGEQGRISSRDLAEAILESGKAIDEAWGNKLPTITQAFNTLNNSLKVAAGESTEFNNLSATLAVALLKIANALVKVIKFFEEYADTIKIILSLLGGLLAYSVVGKILGSIGGALIGLFRGVGQGTGAISMFLERAKDFGVTMRAAGGGLLAFAETAIFTFLPLGRLAKVLGGIVAGVAGFFGIKSLIPDKEEDKLKTYNDELAELRKNLGLVDAEARKSSLAPSGGRTMEQVKNEGIINKAINERNSKFRQILDTQRESLGLTRLQGSELRIQEQVLQINKDLYQEIKNDKGEVIGYTQKLNSEEEKQLRTLLEQNIQGTLRRDVQIELNRITDQYALIRENLGKMSTEQLDIEVKILDAQIQYGKLLDEDVKKQMRGTAELQKQYEYLKQISEGIRKMNTPLQGAAAGAAVVNRLPDLSSSALEQKILTDRETTMNGLKDLLDRGVITENTYQEARLSAEREANAEILASRQKMVETQMKQQGVVNTEIINMVKDQMAAVSMMQQGGIQGVQGTLMAMTNVFDLMKGGNRKAFETYKSLATAQALISTYQAAAMSIAAPPGPPFSYIYVASAILAGMAQVAKIRSMQFSGRAVGGPVVGGQSYIVGEKGPEIFTPGTAGGIIKNSDIMGAGGVNVNFNITATDAASFDQLLVNRRGLITQIISDAMTEKGRRGI